MSEKAVKDLLAIQAEALEAERALSDKLAGALEQMNTYLKSRITFAVLIKSQREALTLYNESRKKNG